MATEPIGAAFSARREALDRGEQEIKDQVLRMASLVEQQIRAAIHALEVRDADLATAVVDGDARVDEAQREASALITTTIALQQPVARDLRFLLSLDRVTYELERIGDHAGALIDVDEHQARAVAAGDDEIDHLYHSVFTEVVELMREDPANVERGTRILFAAHDFERIGDRVTNIAEDVVYLATGQIEDLNP